MRDWAESTDRRSRDCSHCLCHLRLCAVLQSRQLYEGYNSKGYYDEVGRVVILGSMFAPAAARVWAVGWHNVTLLSLRLSSLQAHSGSRRCAMYNSIWG